MSIMKLRIQRLYDKLETVNNRYPDLIQEVISKNKNKYNGYFHIATEVELENQINSLIESIATLSKKSKANITCELLDGFNKSKYEDEESSQENYNWAEKAFKWYKRAAELGHTNAQYNLGDASTQYKLGCMYSQGEGVEQDNEEAAQWYKKAAEQGHAEAQYNLGWFYANGTGVVIDDWANGIGVEGDDQEAFKWYRKAAKQGHAEAQYSLGWWCAHGPSIGPEGLANIIDFDEDDNPYGIFSFEEAAQWYKKAAEQGHAKAQYKLGCMYSQGEVVEQDDEEAFKWYKNSAEQEYANAQYSLGNIYEERQDDEEAFKWYKKSAEQGHAEAQYNLGWFYANGIGVEQDDEEAFKWYKNSAEQEYANAQYSLGYSYHWGEGIEQDYEEAAQWYKKAAELGHANAQYNLDEMYVDWDEMYVDREPDEQDEEEADADAQYNLDEMYVEGGADEQDDEGAVNQTNENIELISTTRYGQIIGINANPYLFRVLKNLNFITKRNQHYELTVEGHKLGGYVYTNDGERFVGWNKARLDKILHPILPNIIQPLEFELFYISHISNLKSILDQGLKCHNDISGNIDISNQNVNKRRARVINKSYGKIHDYVPLYFNPRNAMLFKTCKQYKGKIIILEITKEIITKERTLFSQGNAARGDSYITHCKNKVTSFDWDKIYSKEWTELDSRIVSEEIKSMMMSECLIYKNIPSSYIKKVHCKDSSTANKVSEIIKTNIQEAQISPELYFQF